MYYRKTINLIIVLFVLFSCTGGASNENGNSLLWKVSGNGLQKPSYLFGTHHLVPLSFLDSIPGIMVAFEETELTVGELDMSNMAEMQQKIMQAALMPQDTAYSSLLDNDEIALLDSMLRAVVGVGLNQLSQLKPAMLSNLISISLYQQYYPSMATGENIDNYFQTEALKRSREVKGLETTEDQIHVLLNAQSLERQSELLICMVKHPSLLKSQMDELQTAYHSQDLNALHRLYEQELPDDPCPSTEEEKKLINATRNNKWLEKLPGIMQEKSSFIAVGSLHLPGNEGLIEGLRAQGYHVEAVVR